MGGEVLRLLQGKSHGSPQGKDIWEVRLYYIYIHIPFQILFPYRLLQNIEYGSLCSTVGTCWISVLYIAVVV